MRDNIIVVPGPAFPDLGAVHTVAREFGWTVERSVDLREAAAAHASRRTIAVLFHRLAFGSCSWLESVPLLRQALPDVCPIACHGFAESFDWPPVCEAGAFHSLWFPLKENEVRQSYGFVREAEKRRAESADRVSVIVPARSMAERITSAAA